MPGAASMRSTKSRCGPPRGKLWYLTRRVAEEDSVACLARRLGQEPQGGRPHSTCPASSWPTAPKVNPKRPLAGLRHDAGVRVPDYGSTASSGSTSTLRAAICSWQRPGAGDGAPGQRRQALEVGFSWQGRRLRWPTPSSRPPAGHRCRRGARAFDSVSAGANSGSSPRGPAVRGTLRFDDRGVEPRG